jgi:hypothetical protein
MGIGREHAIKRRISKMDYIYESITEKDKEYLEKIELAIFEIFEREEKAKELLTNNHLSVKTGISRQTIYNRKILLEYIVSSQNDFKQLDISFVNTNMGEKIEKLTKKIQLMEMRDYEIEELRIEVKALRLKLKDRDEEIKRLRSSKNFMSN